MTEIKRENKERDEFTAKAAAETDAPTRSSIAAAIAAVIAKPAPDLSRINPATPVCDKFT